MRFYRLAVNCDPRSNGVRARNERQYNALAETAQWRLSSAQFPDFDPVFSGLVLVDGTKQTDVICDGGAIGGSGFLVSARMKHLLSEFTLPEHRFYPLRLVDEHDRLIADDRYYWLQILFEDGYDWIDYGRSTILTTAISSGVQTVLPVRNAAELRDYLDRHDRTAEVLSYRALVLNEEYDRRGLDLVRFGLVMGDTCISERLKTRIEEEQMTGLEECTLLRIATSDEELPEVEPKPEPEAAQEPASEYTPADSPESALQPVFMEVEMSAEFRDELTAFIELAANRLEITPDMAPQDIVQCIDAYVHSVREAGIGEEELFVRATALGLLWGEQVCRAVGWEWSAVVEDYEAVPGVVAPDRAFICLPIDFLYGILLGQAENTVLRLYTRIASADLPERAPGAYTVLR